MWDIAQFFHATYQSTTIGLERVITVDSVYGTAVLNALATVANLNLDEATTDTFEKPQIGFFIDIRKVMFHEFLGK